MLRRILAFIRGDMVAAEDLEYPSIETPPIVIQARKSVALGKYLVAVGEKSRDLSAAAVDGIQSRASSFMTLVVGLVPFWFAAIALTSPPAGASLVRWAGFLLVGLSTAALIVAAIAAALATGMGRTALQNPAFLDAHMTKAELLADEAETWNAAAQLNMETGRRRAHDLYEARRFVVIALALALTGLVLVLLSAGTPWPNLLQPTAPTPNPTDLVPGPT